MPPTTDKEKRLHRIFKWLSPATQAKFIQAGYTPKRGGANKLSYEDLCLIERLEGPPSEENPPPQLSYETARLLLKGLVDSVPKSAEIIPFKPKPSHERSH